MGVERSEGLCVCGRPETPEAVELVLKDGALQELPRLVEGLGRRQPARGGAAVALFDPTTYALFGAAVLDTLASAGLAARPLVLGEAERPFEPDEAAVEAAETAAARERAVVIGVGSGAINDLGKYVAARQALPYVSVATAPSMDGFAAPISAIVVNKVKTTVPSRAPDAVVADLAILKGAPPSLIAAGFGDVAGKVTSLADWRLAHVLFDEYWCEATAEKVGAIVQGTLAAAPKIAARSPDAVGGLMEALVRAGTSVLHVGHSRPTSGAEHLLSHFIEMWHVNRGLRPPAHGHVVGVGTLIACRVAEALQEVADPLGAPPPAAELPPPGVILAALGIAQMPENFGSSKFDPSRIAQRRARIAARWPEALAALRRLPPAEEVARRLRSAGCPTSLSELGIDRQTAREAIGWCRFLRERYTLFDLAADLGVLPGIVADLVAAHG